MNKNIKKLKKKKISTDKIKKTYKIKEVKDNLQASYSENFEDMGLDLGLIQLEHEVRELGKKIQK